MDARRLKALRKELDTFVSAFAPCIKTEPSRRHFKTYVEGQLSDLERKNAAASHRKRRRRELRRLGIKLSQLRKCFNVF